MKALHIVSPQYTWDGKTGNISADYMWSDGDISGNTLELRSPSSGDCSKAMIKMPNVPAGDDCIIKYSNVHGYSSVGDDLT